MPNDIFPAAQWPYLFALERLALALALGLFVGLERQQRGKEAGVRTFTFACLAGCLSGLLGDPFALAALALIGLLVIFLTAHAFRADHGTELTTSAALIVIGFTGVLCGKGHTFTPTAVGVLTAALLAYKESFTGFSLGLTETEPAHQKIAAGLRATPITSPSLLIPRTSGTKKCWNGVDRSIQKPSMRRR